MSTAGPLQHPGAGGSNTLGKYRLIAELGRGGMSEVFLAVNAGPAGFNKLAVIKQIKTELAEDPDFITMFLEEAQLAARLSHPNIVQTNEVDHADGRYFMAMEYLEGQPYSRSLSRIGRDRGIPLGLSLRVLCEVCAGLHYAHSLRNYDGTALEVVHRDVTPHNVFLTYDGQVKLMDFGIAKAASSSLETRTGVLKGKVGYMAPEQARGERVDCRADIFSVGVMLWEAAVGRRLWKGLSEVAVLHRLMEGQVPRPRDMRPDISEPLEEIIMGALAIDRDLRYGSAATLQRDLEQLIDAPGNRSDVREIGTLVAKAFAEERQRLREVIDRQLSQAQALSTGLYQAMQIPVLAQTSHHPSMSGMESHHTYGQSGAYGAAGESYAPTPSGVASLTPSGSSPHAHASHPSHQSGPSHNGLGAPYGSEPSAPSVQGSYHLSGQYPPAHLSGSGQGSGGKTAIVAGVVFLALLGLGTAAMFAFVDDDPVSTKSAATPNPSVAEPSSPVTPSATAATESDPAPAVVDVTATWTTNPKNARVDIDGAQVPDGKADLERGKSYTFTVSAAGYETETRSVRIGKDAKAEIELDFDLSPAKTSGVYRPPPPPPPGDTAKDPDDMTPPALAPERPLDDNNPYN